MSDGKVTTDRDGHVLRITLNREAKMNSLTPDMMRELAEAWDLLEADDHLRVGILSGAGEAFTSGLDLMKFMGVLSGSEAPFEPSGIDPLQLKARCTKPIIAAVEGVCFTVGIEMVLACDIAVAGEGATFQQMETSRGIMPSGGGTVRWVQHAGWGNAMYHMLRADRFDAAEAFRVGLVQEVVPAGEALTRASVLANEIAANAPLAVREAKRSALRYLAEGEQAAFAALDETQGRLATSQDAMEGVAAMMQKRPADFKGA